MTITTVDGLIAGFKTTRYFHKSVGGNLTTGRPFSHWAMNGVPGPGAFSTSINGHILSSSQVVAISIASPAVVSVTPDHFLVAGDPVYFTTTGALPTGLTANTTYFVVGATVGQYNVALTPGGAAINTSGSQSGTHTAYAQIDGQLPFYDAPAGQSTYMARWAASTLVAGKLMLCDRLWHNGGYSATSNAVQTCTTPQWPDRDNNGGHTGEGVLLALEISAAVGAAAPTIQVAYTNTLGVARTLAPFVIAAVNSMVIGNFLPIALQAGDTGVQSLQSIKLSTSWLAGTINMVAYRVITTIDLLAAAAANHIGPVDGGLPQMFNGSVPFLLSTTPGAAPNATWGTLTVAQG
jgi:hypothetical protein